MTDNNSIKVKTPFGTLVAAKSCDPANQGIYIALQQEDEEGVFETDLVLVESTLKGSRKHELRVMVWSDKDNEDYTHCFNVDSIEGMRKEK